MFENFRKQIGINDIWLSVFMIILLVHIAIGMFLPADNGKEPIDVVTRTATAVLARVFRQQKLCHSTAVTDRRPSATSTPQFSDKHCGGNGTFCTGHITYCKICPYIRDVNDCHFTIAGHFHCLGGFSYGYVKRSIKKSLCAREIFSYFVVFSKCDV